VSSQTEPQHVVAVPPSAPHARPHAPQFELLIDVSMHVLLQQTTGPPASGAPPSGKQSATVRQPIAHV
jgi:hypothetical protein